MTDPDPKEVPAAARPHHYLFSHRWLPGTFGRIPEKIVLALARARTTEPLEESWDRLAKNLPDDERMAPRGLGLEAYRLPGSDTTTYLVTVEMPEVQNPAEAHFAAMIVQPPDGDLTPERDDEDGPRSDTETAYYVLERTEPPARDRPATELRVWNGEAFVDLDDHPEPTENAFVEAVRAHRRDTHELP